MEPALSQMAHNLPPLEALARRAPAVGLAAVTACVIAVVCGEYVIRLLQWAEIAEDTTQTPIEDSRLRKRIEAKNGTPTMGGLIVLIGLVGGTLPWAGFDNPYAWLLLACALGLGLVGGADDWLKIKGRGHRGSGLRPLHKLMLQGAVGADGHVHVRAFRRGQRAIFKPGGLFLQAGIVGIAEGCLYLLDHGTLPDRDPVIPACAVAGKDPVAKRFLKVAEGIVKAPALERHGAGLDLSVRRQNLYIGGGRELSFGSGRHLH